MKATALDVPPAVSMVTGTDGVPVEGGTVTLHVVCVGQVVDAT